MAHCLMPHCLMPPELVRQPVSFAELGKTGGFR
jgi:hypothetical protein